MTDLLFDPTHMVFDMDGTCYDLVLTNDPYGGVLVIWPATGYVWRWHPGDRLKPLTRDVNHHDGNNIFQYLEGTI